MANTKAALITGGAKRIGKAIALHLAQNGYDIALHYNTSKKEANLVKNEINKLGRKCSLYKCNLLNTKELTSLIKEVKKSFPNLSLLINNASIFEEEKFLKTDLSFLDRHLNVNFKAPFFLSQSFAKYCKKGQIINLLDANVTRSKTKYFAYNLSKKMLFEFTKMSAVELAPQIRVNAIAPGPILSPPGKDLNYLQKKGLIVPLQKKGEVKNIIQCIRFLVENNYVTGQCIFVDGGKHLVQN